MVQNIAQGQSAEGRKIDRPRHSGRYPAAQRPLYQANEMVKKGEIGQVTYCEGWWHRNARDGQPGPWAYEIPKNASEENINWNEFSTTPPKPQPGPLFPVRLLIIQRHRQRPDGPPDRRHLHGDGRDLKSVIASGGPTAGTGETRHLSCAFEFEEGFQINYNARFSNTVPVRKIPSPPAWP